MDDFVNLFDNDYRLRGPEPEARLVINEVLRQKKWRLSDILAMSTRERTKHLALEAVNGIGRNNTHQVIDQGAPRWRFKLRSIDGLPTKVKVGFEFWATQVESVREVNDKMAQGKSPYRYVTLPPETIVDVQTAIYALREWGRGIVRREWSFESDDGQVDPQTGKRHDLNKRLQGRLVEVSAHAWTEGDDQEVAAPMRTQPADLQTANETRALCPEEWREILAQKGSQACLGVPGIAPGTAPVDNLPVRDVAEIARQMAQQMFAEMQAKAAGPATAPKAARRRAKVKAAAPAEPAE